MLVQILVWNPYEPPLLNPSFRYYHIPVNFDIHTSYYLFCLEVKQNYYLSVLGEVCGVISMESSPQF